MDEDRDEARASATPPPEGPPYGVIWLESLDHRHEINGEQIWRWLTKVAVCGRVVFVTERDGTTTSVPWPAAGPGAFVVSLKKDTPGALAALAVNRRQAGSTLGVYNGPPLLTARQLNLTTDSAASPVIVMSPSPHDEGMIAVGTPEGMIMHSTGGRQRRLSQTNLVITARPTARTLPYRRGRTRP